MCAPLRGLWHGGGQEPLRCLQQHAPFFLGAGMIAAHCGYLIVARLQAFTQELDFRTHLDQARIGWLLWCVIPYGTCGICHRAG